MTIARPWYERFYPKVSVEDECWVWKGYVGSCGYGWFRPYPVPATMWRAHRFHWCVYFGGVPTGLELDHLCRNRACVRIAHLEPVTRKENVRRGKTSSKRIEEWVKRTHCKWDHAFDVANTYYRDMSAQRGCRKCHAISERNRRARHRVAL